jgi:hypothetical protein
MKKVIVNYFSLSSSSQFRGGEEETPAPPDSINIYLHNLEDPIFIRKDGTPEVWLEIVSINSRGKHVWFICPQSDFFYIINNESAETFDTGKDFLDRLSVLFPNEFEFFLWYPNSIDGEWND